MLMTVDVELFNAQKLHYKVRPLMCIQIYE